MVLDCYYMDAHGKIANEFYIISDNEEGEIKKVQDWSLKKIEDYREIQKIFYNYFLKDTDLKGIASND